MPVTSPRPASRLPAGVETRPARPGDLEAVVALCLRCDLADLGAPDTEPDDIGAMWRRPGYDLARNSVLVVAGDRPVGYGDVLDGEGFGLGLWFLAVEEGELVGVNLALSGPLGGYVAQLAVRRDRRGRGLGQALLRHGFGELYRRGAREVYLDVDSQNRTGATRLYERAGMRVQHRHDHWVKRLR